MDLALKICCTALIVSLLAMVVGALMRAAGAVEHLAMLREVERKRATATAVDEDDSHCLCRAEVWQLEQQIAALKADKAGAAEDWENLKYWRGLITWDSRVGGGDGKELDRLKAYFAEEGGDE